MEDFKKDFCLYFEEEIDDNKIQKFYDYMNLLVEWNKKINLTAITEEKDIILKHFVDSLTVLKYIKENKSIVDVGTGAGFPGIPLAIMNDSLKITLVDSLNKRINFLNEVCSKIKLKNTKAIHSRAEEFGQDNNYRESYDIAISRAVSNLTVLAEYLLPLVKVGGKIICMKGPDIEEELKQAKSAIDILGGKFERCDNFCLPKSDISRNIIIINKIKETPKKYPRKAGTPVKTPLFL
jgi:16S rRNA (guanine527-N7)-methyltransferase